MPKPTCSAASTKSPCIRGHGALYVFALVGRGPIKQETAEIPTQAALLVADRIFDAVGKRNVTPTLAPVKIPQVVNFVPVARLRVGPS